MTLPSSTKLFDIEQDPMKSHAHVDRRSNSSGNRFSKVQSIDAIQSDTNHSVHSGTQNSHIANRSTMASSFKDRSNVILSIKDSKLTGHLQVINDVMIRKHITPLPSDVIIQDNKQIAQLSKK